MKLKQIKIDNFRLLKEFSIDIEENLSLVIGKNNTGKTSFLTLLDKFLNKRGFSFEDFNLKLQKDIEIALKTKIDENKYKDFKINLRLYFEYTSQDNSKNYSKLIMDLDPDNNIYVLSFEYVLDYENYKKLIKDFDIFKVKANHKNILDFLSKNHKHYFKIKKKVIEFKNEENYKDIDDKDINKIINFQVIHAKRDVANEEGDSKKASKTLSKLSYKYFNSRNNINISDITDLQKQLIKTDGELNENYAIFFKPIIESFKKFVYKGESPVLEIRSNLEEVNLLRENTSVRYNQDGHNLPEDYNGLGYLNLFAIIFDIHIKLDELQKANSETESPADINLLFIEEPEAHTHPQMQYVFIKNIKNMLKEATKNKLNLQTIISTHSAHIASQSDFNDIKYFFRKDDYNVIVKNLSDLENEYVPKNRKNQQETPKIIEAKKKFQFLKKYLTLNNSELFFASKAIFIEGDTERILLSAMMDKVDKEEWKNKDYKPLLSQNISIVEVGNYSHIFDKFLDFLSIKTLIITDLDSIKTTTKTNKNGEIQETCITCPIIEGNNTSNHSIKHFLKDKSFEDLKALTYEQKVKNNKIMITYQISENSYYARSFEDSFISLNLDFIKTYKEKFDSLKCREILEAKSPDYYQIAQNCIDKKSVFATDILFYSDENYSNWKIPEYIKEGLKWLAK